MSPIDDELRSLFSERTAVLVPSADPLAGIERRARRMRRNRVAASVAGTALAIAAVAAAVPALIPDTVTRGDSIVPASPGPASPEPSAAATPAGGLPPAALNPQDPWPYRGDASLIAPNELASLRSEWSAKHPGTTLTPLFGDVYQPSGRPEIVFVSTAQGSDRWGVATTSESGWEFVHDTALAYGSTVLMAALSGDEVPRLLVLAAPSTGEISYAKDGTSYTSISRTDEPGVGFQALEGDTSRDYVRVLDGNGDMDSPVFEGPAPDRGAADSAGAPDGTTPANLVTWPSRGATPDPAFLEKALTVFAQGLGAKRTDVEGKVLFAGDDDSRNVFVFGQAWIKGNDAHTFGYSVNADGEATPFLGPVTSEGPAVLAFVVAPGTGQTRETLVVIPEPAVRTTYYGEARSEYIEIVGQDYLGGVSLIDRRPGVEGDKIKLLDATGNKVFEDEVAKLLCGVKSCG